jgi:TolB protein
MRRGPFPLGVLRGGPLPLAVLLVLAAGAAAEDRPVVVVTPGSARTFHAALQDFADRSQAPDPARAPAFREQLGRALDFSGVFEILPQAAFLGPETTGSLDADPSFLCSDWTQIGADAVVQGELSADGELRAEFRVWDPVRCESLVRKRYRQPLTADAGQVARRIADDIVAAFIGMRGVASTEIAFVSNRSGNPEIYVMGADGSNQRSATSNRSINNFPAWSPDGDSIVYTSYRIDDRPLLFVSTRGRGHPGRLLSRLDGDHSEYRGVFSPKGDRLAVVLTRAGAGTDVFTVRPDGRSLRPLTAGDSIDVGPAWSPDGERIAFVSDRAGSPQIYIMDADGSNQRRLTFQGTYNTHPAWSPDGSWIAYESRVGGQFDLWLIDPEGTVNLPIVTHPRSDESPSWAPNSRKIAFSSRRRGRADIYVVDVNGENLRRLTEGSGDNTSPAWGPFSR